MLAPHLLSNFPPTADSLSPYASTSYFMPIFVFLVCFILSDHNGIKNTGQQENYRNYVSTWCLITMKEEIWECLYLKDNEDTAYWNLGIHQKQF